MPAFHPTFSPASHEQVADFEKLHSLRLPADYREFLLEANGGTPTPNVLNVGERGDSAIGWLFGIRNGRVPGDLEYEQAEATQWDPLPPGYIAVGDNPGGCLLLLGTAGDDAGRVYFFDRVGLWRREDGRNTFPAATTFTAFLASLHD